MRNQRVRTKTEAKAKKPEVTLMTLLAYDATEDARKLLKKHNKPDARNCSDLELKLAQLYFEVPVQERVVLEKELAEIHPHKDWLLKYISPATTVIAEPAKQEIKVEDIKEIKANCEGNPDCSCNKKMSNACGCSSFSGVEDSKPSVIHLQKNDYVGIIGLVAVIGLAFYVIKNK